MCASASASSGPMWMNWAEVQHAVHVPHGTSMPPSPSPCWARRKSPSQVENRPAGSPSCFVVAPSSKRFMLRPVSGGGELAPVSDGMVLAHLGQPLVEGGGADVVLDGRRSL